MTKSNTATCNHCKKEFKSDDHRATTVTVNVYDSNSPGWTCGGTELDLCPACLELFAKFFHKQEYEL